MQCRDRRRPGHDGRAPRKDDVDPQNRADRRVGGPQADDLRAPPERSADLRAPARQPLGHAAITRRPFTENVSDTWRSVPSASPESLPAASARWRSSTRAPTCDAPGIADIASRQSTKLETAMSTMNTRNPQN